MGVVRTTLEILVADDEPDIIAPITELLRGQGHHVTSVASGSAAMEALDAHVFDLVITDVRLPHVDGWTILRRVRAQTPAADIVLITAHGSVSDAVHAIKEE